MVFYLIKILIKQPNHLNLLPISKNNLSLDFKIRRFLQGMNYKTQFKNTMFLSPISIEDLKEIFNEKIEIEDLFSHLMSRKMIINLIVFMIGLYCIL